MPRMDDQMLNQPKRNFVNDGTTADYLNLASILVFVNQIYLELK